jgi:flagellar biosynthesis/type III secretory pathway M-ring protein FliF/YscJ
MPIPGKKPAKSNRTPAELSAEAAKWAAKLNQGMAKPAPKQPASKEDKIREMLQDDPQKAAELIRQMFLRGK